MSMKLLSKMFGNTITLSPLHGGLIPNIPIGNELVIDFSAERGYKTDYGTKGNIIDDNITATFTDGKSEAASRPHKILCKS